MTRIKEGFIPKNICQRISPHIRSIQVCINAKNNSEDISASECNVIIHVFRLNNDEVYDEIESNGADEEEVIAAHSVDLPNVTVFFFFLFIFVLRFSIRRDITHVQTNQQTKYNYNKKILLKNGGILNSLVFDDETEDIKDRLLSYMWTTLLFSDKHVNSSLICFNRVVLLHGPPGTGKTSLCKALAQKIAIRLSHRFQHATLIEINAHSLFSKWFSESGKLVLKLFAHIQEKLEDKNTLVCCLIGMQQKKKYFFDWFIDLG
ncbi:hypothetical protein RFI_03242 [Reticulomyxa filosa]|uniref:ATPase AAA-type core domain-containing protein n=1 Tax=Reticulomyxa filosa TaxID=46433 RepID=X6P6Q4_RETFI|nr:hypothetical protein RFI_03242 [Reticulomyxa filosa]|eukprot:ETO33856.1 hypothetical protein RFI_03242 [Reticulomyxa filosa]